MERARSREQEVILKLGSRFIRDPNWRKFDYKDFRKNKVCSWHLKSNIMFLNALLSYMIFI
ncbi:hypothetical protein EBU02_09165 [bacterium]|nr:hypothetical protein [bacterium]NBS52800.1 hypothetical protein [Spartobacteria bacterium]